MSFVFTVEFTRHASLSDSSQFSERSYPQRSIRQSLLFIKSELFQYFQLLAKAWKLKLISNRIIETSEIEKILI